MKNEKNEKQEYENEIQEYKQEYENKIHKGMKCNNVGMKSIYNDEKTEIYRIYSITIKAQRYSDKTCYFTAYPSHLRNW